MQGRRVLSFLPTKKKPAATGEEEGSDETSSQGVLNLLLHGCIFRLGQLKQAAGR